MILTSRDGKLRGSFVSSFRQSGKLWFRGVTSDGVEFFGTENTLVMVMSSQEYEELVMRRLKFKMIQYGGNSGSSIRVISQNKSEATSSNRS